MLSGDYTGLGTGMAIGAILGTLWLVSICLFSAGIVGLLFKWSVQRVRMCLGLGLTIALILSPLFAIGAVHTLNHWDTFRVQNPQSLYYGIGMPASLALIVVLSFFLLRVNSARIQNSK
jgi:phosphatidylserine synthase